MKSGAVQYPLECIVFYMDVVSVFVFEMLQTTKYQLRLRLWATYETTSFLPPWPGQSRV